MTDQEFAYHECPQTLALMMPTYPGSEKLFKMLVCADCEEHWHDYRYSSPSSFFANEVPREILTRQIMLLVNVK